MHPRRAIRDRLVVDEQVDEAGDVLYVICLSTHCQATVEKFGEIFGLEIVYRNNQPHDHTNDH